MLMRFVWEAPYPATTAKLRAFTLQFVEIYGSLDPLLSQCPRLKELNLVSIGYINPPVAEVRQTQQPSPLQQDMQHNVKMQLQVQQDGQKVLELQQRLQNGEQE